MHLARSPLCSRATKTEVLESSRIFPSEGLQDRAVFRTTVSRAGVNERRQTVPYLLESGNPRLNVGKLCLGGTLDAPYVTRCREREH